MGLVPGVAGQWSAAMLLGDLPVTQAAEEGVVVFRGESGQGLVRGTARRLCMQVTLAESSM